MYKMFIFYFLVMMMYNFTAPVTPEMLLDKGVIPGLNSYLVAIFSVAVFFGSPIAAKYIDANGIKKVMMFIPLFMALSQFIMYFSPGSIGLLVGRGLVGFFAAFFFLGGSIYVNEFSSDENKSQNFAYLMVAASLGGIVGQMFIGVLSNVFYGYLYAFIFTLLISIALIIIGNFSIKEIEKKEHNEQKEKKKFKLTPMLLLVSILAAAFIVYAGNIGYYFMDQLNATTDKVAMINSLYLIVLLISNLFIIKYIERWFNLNVLFTLQIAGGIVGMILLSYGIYTTSTLVIFVSLLLFLFSLSIFLPLAQKYVVTKNADNSSDELGFINSSYSLGMVVGSVIGGVAYSINPNLMFLIIIVMLTIALVIHLTELQKEKKTTQKSIII